MAHSLLSVRNLAKHYGRTQALRHASFDVDAHTIHALIGHNGSGKSTLVKILAGITSADAGSIVLNGLEITRLDSKKRPIAAVYQDLPLVPSLPVVDNVFAGQWGLAKRFGLIKWREQRATTTRLLASLGLDIDVRQDLRTLSTTDRVLCYIARALIRAGVTDDRGSDPPRVLLLDEPTSALADEEIGRFFALLKSIRDRFQVAIILVTHNPRDVEELCDHFTALRAGEVTMTGPVSELSHDTLLQLMSGAMSEQTSLGISNLSSPPTSTGSTEGRMVPPARSLRKALAANRVQTPGLARAFTLSVDAGEIVCLTGLVGSGYEVALRAIVGAVTTRSGSVTIRETSVRCDLNHFKRAGGIFIARGRLDGAGVGDALVRENLLVGISPGAGRRVFVTAASDRALISQVVQRLGLKQSDGERSLAELSGGQQQKVILGRAILSGASVIALEEPTEAIDVGARLEVIRLMRDAARAGAAILISTAEYESISDMCDRAIVFRRGQVSAELKEGEMNSRALLDAM